MTKLDIDKLFKNNSLEKFENEENIIDIINDIKQSFYDIQNYNLDNENNDDIDNIIDNKNNNENNNYNQDNKIHEHFGADPFKKIGDFIKKLEGYEKSVVKFFKSIPKLFKKIINAFKMSTQKLIAIVLTIMIPFLGQLYARIVLLNGSLEMPYLFLISFPPLSLLPALLMVFDIIPDGKGEAPWDKYILIPILSYIFSLLLDVFLTNINIILIARILIILISFFIAFYHKSIATCNKAGNFNAIVAETLLVYVLILIIPIMLLYLPIIGSIIKIFTRVVPGGNILLQIAIMFIVYVIINMLTNYLKKEYCNSKVNNKHLLCIIICALMFSYSITIPNFLSNIDN